MIPYILAAVGGYLIGDSLKGKQYADGGMTEKGEIKDQYENMSPKQVWEKWNSNQREHFVSDHYQQWNGSWSEDMKSLPKLSFEKVVKKVPHFESALIRHISMSQYADGGMMEGIYAYGGRPAKNYRTLLNEFEKEKPSIAIGLISDDVATGMMSDKFSQSVQWEKLSDEEKKKYNEDYRTNLIEFRNFILKEFVKKYYSDEKVKSKCKGDSRSTIESIKKEMTKIAETYPKEKY